MGCTWPEGLQGLELLVQCAPCHNVCIIIPGASPVMLHYRPVSTLEHLPVLCAPYSQHTEKDDLRVSMHPANQTYRHELVIKLTSASLNLTATSEGHMVAWTLKGT